MSKLSELIAKLCPNGVEYKKLGEVAEILRGKRLTKSDLSDDNPFPVFHGGLLPLGYYSQSNRDKDTVMIINVGASAGTVGYCKEQFWASDGCFCLSKNDIALSKYLYYVLQSKELEIKGKVRVAGIPTLDSQAVASISIPLPPLAIQSEIVKILDNFAELTAELTAELEKRKKQYEHYRDMLLNGESEASGAGGASGASSSSGSRDSSCSSCSSCSRSSRTTRISSTTRWVKLGEIGGFYSGLSGKTKNDFKDGNAKFITYMNVYSNPSLKIDVDDKVKITEGEKQNVIEYGDVLFTGSSETPDECGMTAVLTQEAKEPLYLNSFCFGYRLFDKKLYLPDFLKHLFRSSELRKQIRRTANGVTRFNVSKVKMLEVQIPLPPLAEQERIVAILDRFDSLCNSLTEGLPAEIELRKKQYEYYRDKLLSFGVASDSSNSSLEQLELLANLEH